MNNSIEIYCLLPETKIHKDRVELPCGNDILPWTTEVTFWPTGTWIDDKQIVGIQFTFVDDFITQMDGADLWSALVNADSGGWADYFICMRGQLSILYGKYPHLSGYRVESIGGVETKMRNFNEWGGVI